MPQLLARILIAPDWAGYIRDNYNEHNPARELCAVKLNVFTRVNLRALTLYQLKVTTPFNRRATRRIVLLSE